ncbi:MAG: hypothetical protein ABJE66_00575 [Deltaproteobacteria bacterium]
MMLKLPLVFACSLVAGGAGSALADPPRPDPGVPPLNPPTDPMAPVTDTPAPMTPAPVTTTTTTVDTTAPVREDLDVPPGTPVPGVTANDGPILVVHDRPDALSYAWHDPYLVSGIGVGFTVGGGLTGFTDRAMRNTVSANVGGLWDARASFGTHIPIGLDVGYIGSAANINTIDGHANGTLVGTTIEAALRYNILPHNTFNPYLFAGAGWQRYDVTNMHFAQSDTGMAPHDNVAEFPMGAGFGVRDVSGFNFDLRGTFRATTDSTLLQENNGNYAQLHSWEASGSVGYEF